MKFKILLVSNKLIKSCCLNKRSAARPATYGVMWLLILSISYCYFHFELFIYQIDLHLI